MMPFASVLQRRLCRGVLDEELPQRRWPTSSQTAPVGQAAPGSERSPCFSDGEALLTRHKTSPGDNGCQRVG